MILIMDHQFFTYLYIKATANHWILTLLTTDFYFFLLVASSSITDKFPLYHQL